MNKFIKKALNIKIDGKSRRILLFLAVITGGVLVYSSFQPRAPTVAESRLGGISLPDETVQGTEPVSEEYGSVLAKADGQRVDQAKDRGTSALPTIIRTDASEVETAPVAKTEADPPQVRKEPKRRERPIGSRPMVPFVEVESGFQADLDSGEVARLTNFLSALRTPKTAVGIIHLQPDTVTNEPADTITRVESTEQVTEDSEVMTPPAGTVLFGQLLNRIGSESPGPVLATILQGRYAGSRLIGRFETNRNSTFIQFDQMVVIGDLEGEPETTISINAVAVDTKYVGTAIPSVVDRHFVQNIAVGFVAGFTRGIGDSLARFRESTTTGTDGSITTTTERLGLRDALVSATGQALADTGSLLHDWYGNRPVTITVEAGTPIGILFLN